METSIINYIVKRIETGYNLHDIDKAKEIYISYFNQDAYKELKYEVDKQLIDKNLEFLIDKSI